MFRNFLQQQQQEQQQKLRAVIETKKNTFQTDYCRWNLSICS